MAEPPTLAEAVQPVAVAELLEAGDLKGCCAAVYENAAVRWLLGDQLHPGGEDLTRRGLDLIEVGSSDRVLDVASGAGHTALLAAKERGCEAVGVDYGAGAVAQAAAVAQERGLAERVAFVEGDAEQLPFGVAEFDALICECSLCTFPDKVTAVAEMRRVLRAGGRLLLSDVTVEPEQLPEQLTGALATVACVGDALSDRGYRELLESGGFELEDVISARPEVEELTADIKDRLRGARILGFDAMVPLDGGLDAAIELIDLARQAVADGALSYNVYAARLPG
ncbi:MAG: class I SAM-dependent methyltransferase [Solirubrobacterales bacterium]